MHELMQPLGFIPIYHSLVWGGRRMAAWRQDLPSGPIGESWDLADHERGTSVVAEGALAGRTLRELVRDHGRALIGASWSGGEFPLLVKLIDATDRLSVQVHPDDELARQLHIGTRGKTECWVVLADGGEVFAGLRPGVTKDAFLTALSAGRVSECLIRHAVQAGDVVYLPARTVHALGKDTLIYEVQQTCDITFRVDDWGRVGLDGRPRQLHLREALATIDFAGTNTAPLSHPPWQVDPAGGEVRPLAAGRYFSLVERRGSRIHGDGDSCAVITCLAGDGTLSTGGGSLRLQPMRSYLVPACAGAWRAEGRGAEPRLLIAQPR